MAENPSSPEAEAAAIRRRWITLAEIVGVAGLLVSGLALWNSYQERNSEAPEKAAARREALAQSLTVVLRGTADREGARLSLAPADPAQTFQSQTIAFPAALGIAPIETVADPRIEARWFRREILRATAGDDEPSAGREGDRQVPIAITSRFYSGGAMFTDTAVYALIYRVEGGGLFEGRKIRLGGLSRLQLAGADDPAAARTRINAMWTAQRREARPRP